MDDLDIYSFIKSQEEAYKLPIPIVDGYEWSMYEHLRKAVLYKNSQLLTGKTDDKPVKNIVLPILRLQYRTEGFDVKDIELFVNDKDDYYKSFVLRKYHDKWARENKVDTLIDSIVESYVDYGTALVKYVDKKIPELVPLTTIAFADQTDLLNGAIGIKHNLSVSQLKEMEARGWGNPKRGATHTIDEVIELSKNQKTGVFNSDNSADTPTNYIEVYEVHGILPKSWLKDDYTDDEKKSYTQQMHIVCFYNTEEGRKGICLYKGEESESVFRAIHRDEIYGRACGLGGVEELEEAQVWTTYSQIAVKAMLDAASKTVYKTTDPSFTTRNNVSQIRNQEVLVLDTNTDFNRVDNQPANLTAFENNILKWDEHARQLGGAGEAIMGESPTAGTPFKLQELVTQEAHSLHEYRQGKLAVFLEQIYREAIIPLMAKELAQGDEFIAHLDLDEMQMVVESVINCEFENYKRKQLLNGVLVFDEDLEKAKEDFRNEFMRSPKKFIKILKDEMAELPLDVTVNVAGKQKRMNAQTDKLVNVFRQLASAPQMLDDPRLAKIFNEILESSGLSPVDFYQKPPNQPQLAEMQPLQAPQLTQ